MKAKLIIFAVTLAWTLCGISDIYACCDDPDASMTASDTVVCVGCSIEFDATDSSDPDCSTCDSCGGVSMKKGIRKFEWDWTNNGSYDHTESPGDGKASQTYSTAGNITCKLRVTDDDDDCCCDGSGCDDKTDTTTLTVRVVEVNEVVANVSPYDNNGPLYACIDGSVGLKAKAYPSGSFPSGEPDWTIESQPAGASVTLFPASGSATTSLGGLTKSGTYEVKAKCGSNDTGDTITIEVIEITSTSVTVDANATQTNVTGAENWAALKDAGEYVIVKATVTPSISGSNLPSCFYWTGGEEVPGEPLKRRVSKAVSAKTRVTATAGTSSDYVDIWILWVSLTMKMTGNTPANAAQFGALFDGTEKLGAIYYDSNDAAAGKVVAVGTISPSGVESIVTSGWEIKRDRWSHDFADGSATSVFDTDWTNDTSSSSWLKLTPDANAQIFDTDGPNIKQAYGASDSVETYNNFRQWVKWSCDPASNQYTYWYWKGRWKTDQSPEVTLKQVGTGSISLPGANDAYYDPP